MWYVNHKTGKYANKCDMKAIPGKNWLAILYPYVANQFLLLHQEVSFCGSVVIYDVGLFTDQLYYNLNIIFLGTHDTVNNDKWDKIFMTEPPHCSIVLPTFREFHGQVEQESANNGRSAN